MQERARPALHPSGGPGYEIRPEEMRAALAPYTARIRWRRGGEPNLMQVLLAFTSVRDDQASCLRRPILLLCGGEVHDPPERIVAVLRELIFRNAPHDAVVDDSPLKNRTVQHLV